MRIAELWRYPVKSMGGTAVDAVGVDDRGIHADRLWAVRDVELGAVTTARRLPVLLTCTARFAQEPRADAGPGRVTDVVVTFPDGEERRSDDPAIHAKLSELIGKPVQLVPLPARENRAAYKGVLANQADLRRQFDIPDAEPLPDLSMLPVRRLAELARYATPVGTFADVYPLHVLTRASLELMAAQAPQATFDVRRFRPSIVVDTDDAPGLVEFGWCGGTLTAACGVTIRPEVPTIRCSMPTRVQPGLAADPDVIRTVKALADRCLGVYAQVGQGGRLAVGEALTYQPPETPTPIGLAVGRLRSGLRKGVVRASNAAMPKGR
jgi:uncharacterized protein YcbX